MNDIPPDMVKAVDKLKKIIGGREMEIRSVPPIHISAFDIIDATGQFQIGTVTGHYADNRDKPTFRILRKPNENS